MFNFMDMFNFIDVFNLMENCFYYKTCINRYFYKNEINLLCIIIYFNCIKVKNFLVVIKNSFECLGLKCLLVKLFI